jgi:two-component system NtrC family response regulator
VERLVILVDHPVLDGVDLLEHLDRKGWRTDAVPQTLQELKTAKKRLLEESYGQLEKAFLIKALAAADQNITLAARRVGMQRSNFSTLLKKHRLSPDRRRPG